MLLGAVLSATSLAGDSKQMWRMEEGVIKTVTKDFSVVVAGQDPGAEVILTKNPDNPDDVAWIVEHWGGLYFYDLDSLNSSL